MPTVAVEPPRSTTYARILSWLQRHLNFYRIHILYFIFSPLVFSAVFFACNGEFTIKYVDALFNCVSAMTVTGLATVDLSSLTAWQQVILFIQMLVGNPVFISWFVVFFRRRVFMERCGDIVEAARKSVPLRDVEANRSSSWRARLFSLFRRGSRLSTIAEVNEDALSTPAKGGSWKERKNSGHDSRKLRTDMIRRMDDAPKLVNPSGWISEGRSDPATKNVTIITPEKAAYTSPPPEDGRQLSFVDEESSRRSSGSTDSLSDGVNHGHVRDRESGHLQVGAGRSRSMSVASERRINRIDTMASISERPQGTPMPRTQTIEFAPTPAPQRPRRGSVQDPRNRLDHHPTISELNFRRPSLDTITSAPTNTRGTVRRSSFRQTPTYQSTGIPTRDANFGGFPLPHQLVSRVIDRWFPRLRRQLSRTITMPRTQTIASQHGGAPTGARVVPYISFDAIVGRNSVFHELTSEQLDELGGVEYRALTALLWIVAGYFFLVQLVAYVVIAPYMTLPQWRHIFEIPQQHRNLKPAWFSLFQVVSAFTNSGVSLVDQSMVPFQRAYPMIIFLFYLVLAGNTAFVSFTLYWLLACSDDLRQPIFLRFYIWLLTKIVPSKSRAHETLHFLLDHPRRCFIYLFPSHQTWFLFTVLAILNFTDWFFFLVLDIGNPEIEALPIGVRIIDACMQGVAVRAAGFATVTVAGLAPAVKVAYVIMMYISVYPIALSVRSTNVYEGQSLGIYREDEEEDAIEDNFSHSGNRMTVWSRYLAMHARKQLSFDMWWLGGAVFLVCIIERSKLSDANASWFDIFSIMFEIVSAYGTVGLSLGLPFANYSLSGEFRPLSKLIVCVVMLRGRHRGLPVAIDRAVLLPFEYRREGDEGERADGLGTTSMRRTMTTATQSAHNVGRGVAMNEKAHGMGETRHRTTQWTSSPEREEGSP
ncbi:cation transport protein-domain-containing protein [Amylostereum chailletii]|nr:cation transport protein-domain-containing protein [Amylostereum chailletii]